MLLCVCVVKHTGSRCMRSTHRTFLIGERAPAAGVEPDDIVMLVLSWHFNAAVMYEYQKEEFEEGEEPLPCS